MSWKLVLIGATVSCFVPEAKHPLKTAGMQGEGLEALGPTVVKTGVFGVPAV